MPVIHTYTSTPITPAQEELLKAAFGKTIALVPGKSEQWLMCAFEPETSLYLGGTNDEPAALVTVDVYARQPVKRAVWEKMTSLICDTLQEVLGIDPARIYVKYGSTPDFGWNGMNF